MVLGSLGVRYYRFRLRFLGSLEERYYRFRLFSSGSPMDVRY
jgi:hypothetical protein